MKTKVLLLVLVLVSFLGCAEENEERSWTEFFASSCINEKTAGFANESLIYAGTKYRRNLYLSDFKYSGDDESMPTDAVMGAELGASGDLFLPFGYFNINTGEYKKNKRKWQLFSDTSYRTHDILTVCGDTYTYFKDGVFAKSVDISEGLFSATKEDKGDFRPMLLRDGVIILNRYFPYYNDANPEGYEYTISTRKLEKTPDYTTVELGLVIARDKPVYLSGTDNCINYYDYSTHKPQHNAFFSELQVNPEVRIDVEPDLDNGCAVGWYPPFISDNGKYVLLSGAYYIRDPKDENVYYRNRTFLLIELSGGEFEIKWQKEQRYWKTSNVGEKQYTQAYPINTKYFLAGNEVKVITYENGMSRVSTVNLNTGSLEFSANDIFIRGNITHIQKNLGNGRFLVETDTRYVRRFDRVLQFDVLDLKKGRMLIAGKKDPVYPGTGWGSDISVQMLSSDGKYALSMFPDELGVIDTQKNLTVAKPRKGYFFSAASKGEGSSFIVTETPLPGGSIPYSETRTRVISATRR